jgi:hypothetical protein
LIDTRTDSRDLERRLVVDGYLKDPDFDRWYPLSAVLSLVTTPPPAPLEQLTTPTMFVVASEGPTPDYIVDLYQRLPAIPKRLIQVDGSVYWMLSHQRQATALIADWFSATGLTVKTCLPWSTTPVQLAVRFGFSKRFCSTPSRRQLTGEQRVRRTGHFVTPRQFLRSSSGH